MAETEPKEIPELQTYWHHVPSYFVDGAIGAAWAGGIHRIVLGEICMNVEAGAQMPANRPVLNLIMSTEAIRHFINYLQSLPGVKEK